MSGPKGMSYGVVETAEQRARRELVAAQSAVRSSLAAAQEMLARARTLGIEEPTPDPGTPTTVEACGVARSALDETVVSMQHRIGQVVAMQARQLAERTLAEALAGSVPGGALGLGRHGAAGARQGSASSARAGDDLTDEGAASLPHTPASRKDGHRPARDDALEGPSGRRGQDDSTLVDDVRRALERLEAPDESVQELAREALSAPLASARLLTVRLSGAVDHLNTEAHRAAREEQLRQRALAEEEANAQVMASDRRFVLDQVVSSLQDLGYTVAGTSVVEPDQMVLTGGGVAGYGVSTGLSQDGEIVLRPVRTDEGATPHDLAAEESLCASLPVLEQALARRGVGVGRVRSMPPGIVPVPVEGVTAVHGSAEGSRHSDDRAAQTLARHRADSSARRTTRRSPGSASRES